MIVLPVYFSRPSDDLIIQISKLLEGLPIVSESDLTSWREDAPNTGNKEEVIGTIAEALKQDFAKNALEATTMPWPFDYVMDNFSINDVKALRGLSITTRLISPKRGQGNVLYGPMIFRTSETKYSYWLE